MDKYIYPAIFTLEEDGYTINFPDFPNCITCGDDLTDALAMAKEALELHIYNMEEDNDILPKPSTPTDVKLEKNQFVNLIETHMPLIRYEMANKSVKKTLTVPKWLNDLAIERNINFSQVLQYALQEELGVKTNLLEKN